MAQPTEAQIRTLILDHSTLLDNALAYGGEDATNLVDDLETFLGNAGAYSTSQIAAATSGGQAARNRMNAVVSVASGRAMLDPLWNAYCDLLDIPNAGIERRLRLLLERFDADSDSVLERNLTYGTPAAAGGNIGDGSILRCTVDEFGENLEAAYDEVKTFLCVRDQTSNGLLHEEVFEIRGEPLGLDELAREGSGVNLTIAGISSRRSLLKNASFDAWRSDTADATALTSIPNWTVDTIANLEADSANFYRTAGGSSTATAYGLNMTGAVKLTQGIRDQSIRIDPTRPVHLQIAYNRQVGSGIATLNLRLGSQSTSVALSGQTGWNVLSMPIGSASWLQNWNEDGADIEVELSSYTSGEVLVDDVILTQFIPVDGTFWAVVGGETPFLIDDSITATDTVADASVVQKWLWRLYAAYLPSVASSPTWTGS